MCEPRRTGSVSVLRRVESQHWQQNMRRWPNKLFIHHQKNFLRHRKMSVWCLKKESHFKSAKSSTGRSNNEASQLQNPHTKSKIAAVLSAKGRTNIPKVNDKSDRSVHNFSTKTEKNCLAEKCRWWHHVAFYFAAEKRHEVVFVQTGWFVLVQLVTQKLLILGDIPSSCQWWAFLDIDECRVSNGNCAQLCVNTRGSFTCTCTPGYQLGTDGRTCYREYKYSDFVTCG